MFGSCRDNADEAHDIGLAIVLLVIIIVFVAVPVMWKLCMIDWDEVFDKKKAQLRKQFNVDKKVDPGV